MTPLEIHADLERSVADDLEVALTHENGTIEFGSIIWLRPGSALMAPRGGGPSKVITLDQVVSVRVLGRPCEKVIQGVRRERERARWEAAR